MPPTTAKQPSQNGAPTTPVTAYSYVRFSDPKQADGDSLRRQVELAEQYCQRRGWALDDSLSLRDLGVSAFRGKNALVGRLGAFLDAVQCGKVRAGSALIVESVDRISRQGIDEGYDVCKRILKAGLHIITLAPERDFGPEAVKSLSKGALELQLILERAAEESERKSERVAAAWVTMRKRARENGDVVTRRLPHWIAERNGKLEVIAERAAVIKRIFDLAANGYGWMAIVKKLNDEGVPAFGRKGFWTRSYVAIILQDRRAVGEYQPHLKGEPEGDPIKGYYPAVVDEARWLVANGAITQRRRRKGGDNRRWTEDEDNLVRDVSLTATETAKRTKRTRPAVLQRRSFLLRKTTTTPETVRRHSVNLFTGLIRNVRNGQPYYSAIRVQGKDPWHVLIDKDAVEGRGPACSFPLDTFEKAVLSMLREIDPRDLTADDKGSDEVDVLEAELSRVKDSIALIENDLNEHGDSPALYKRLRQKEAEKKELEAKLAEARQRVAVPLSESWGECQSLITLLDNAPDPDDARLRLRSALRRIIDQIWLFVAPCGRDRVAAVQVVFAGGQSRSYWILHRPPKANKSGRRPGLWWACSVRHESGDLSGLDNLKGNARAEASARFEADLVPAVLRAAEADLKVRQLLVAAEGRAPAGIIDPETGVVTWVEIIE